MAKLIIIYDPRGVLSGPIPQNSFNLKSAQMEIAADLDPNDISTVAFHLAELLLEQIARKP